MMEAAFVKYSTWCLVMEGETSGLRRKPEVFQWERDCTHSAPEATFVYQLVTMNGRSDSDSNYIKSLVFLCNHDGILR